MIQYEDVKNRFYSDVKHHRMTILHNDGLYRHIRFSRPEDGVYYFDLVTYPHHLVISGDMGSYTFTRIEDMFKFFLVDGMNINPHYWSEKLIAVDGNRLQCGCTEFDEDKFDKIIREYYKDWVKQNRHQTTREDRRELLDAIECDVLQNDGEYKVDCAYRFSHYVNEDAGDFCFEDLWEYDFTRFTHHYLWCCYAIAWGIQKYNEETK